MGNVTSKELLCCWCRKSHHSPPHPRKGSQNLELSGPFTGSSQVSIGLDNAYSSDSSHEHTNGNDITDDGNNNSTAESDEEQHCSVPGLPAAKEKLSPITPKNNGSTIPRQPTRPLPATPAWAVPTLEAYEENEGIYINSDDSEHGKLSPMKPTNYNSTITHQPTRPITTIPTYPVPTTATDDRTECEHSNSDDSDTKQLPQRSDQSVSLQPAERSLDRLSVSRDDITVQKGETSPTYINIKNQDPRPQTPQRRQRAGFQPVAQPSEQLPSSGEDRTMQIDETDYDYTQVDSSGAHMYKALQQSKGEYYAAGEPYEETVTLCESTERRKLPAALRDELISQAKPRSQATQTINKTVVLRGRNLKWIPMDDSYDAETVKSLDLAYNKGINVAGDITKFVFLINLCLKDCSLTEFPVDVLWLEKLKYLDLSNSHSLVDKKMPEATVGSEETIQIKACGIPSLPSDVGRLCQLEELHISGNLRLSLLPLSMENMHHLRKLDISWCGFTELPEVCGRLPAMESLKLSGNNLCASTGMQRSISMDNLRRIEVNDCGISELSEIAKVAPKLQHLIAGQNKFLENVPKEISMLESLVALDLPDCNIKKIADSIGILPKLTKLHLSENPGFGYISPSLIRLQCLQKLNLSKCCFSTLPSDIGDIKELEDLDMSWNPKLDSLPTSISRLKKLKILKLKGCAFSELPEYIEEIATLRFLDLSDNRLGEFPLVALKLRKLIHLDLSNELKHYERNKIKQIPLQIIGSTLQTMKLDNNPVYFPPMEKCAQGVGEVRRYMTDLIDQGCIYSDTVTVVGEPGSGKSSVIKLLMGTHLGETNVTYNHQEVDSSYVAIGNSHWVKVNHLFGKLSQQVVPVMFPVDGLTLIVYNMSKDPNSTLEKKENIGGLEEVRKWIILMLMRCARPRIVVVGTHTDKMEELARDLLEREMKKQVEKLFTSIEEECKEYLTEMKSHKDSALLNHNKDVLKRLSEINNKHHGINVLAISCTEDKDLCRNFLINAISEKLRRNKPARSSWWCNVICELLAYQPKENVIYLDWNEITEIFQRHVHPSELCLNDALKDVIRYLRDISQVIWIEEHKFLSNYVFHQPQLITKAGIKVLEHFGSQSLQTERSGRSSRSYRQQCSSDGCASNQVLHQVMDISSDSANIVIELLKHFHIISEVANGPNGRFFVNMAALPNDAPRDVYSIESNFQPRITISLVFLDSIMPRAFPFSTLAVVLEWAHSHYEKPLVWRNGCFFKIHQKSVLVTQDSGFMELTAISESEEDDLWSILIDILRLVNVQHGRGTPLIAKVQCPGCRCCGKCPYPENCPERDHTNLMCLINPEVRDSGTQSFCTDCKKYIPKCLKSSHHPGNYTTKDKDAVAKFYAELRQTCRCSSGNPRDISSTAKRSSAGNPNEALRKETGRRSTEVQRTFIIEQIKAQRTRLLEELTLEDVTSILDKFHETALLPVAEEEKVIGLVKSIKGRDAVRCLLDIIENRGNECAQVFMDVLASENIKKTYLKDAIITSEILESK